MKKMRKIAIILAAAMVFGLFAAVVLPARVQANQQLATPTGLWVDGSSWAEASQILRWNPVANAASYEIWLHTDNWSTRTVTTTNSVNLHASFAILTHLSPGQHVSFSVTAIAPGAGFTNSGTSYVSWTMPGAWGGGTPPTWGAPPTPSPGQLPAPMGLWVDANDTLRWNHVTNSTRYYVRLEVWQGGVWTMIGNTSTTNNFVHLFDVFSIPSHWWHGQHVRLAVLAAAPGDFTTSHPNFTQWPIFGHWPDWPSDWWGGPPAWTPPPAPSAGQLHAPDGLWVDSNNVLRWNPVANATQYTVRLEVWQGGIWSHYGSTTTTNDFLHLFDAFSVPSHWWQGQHVRLAVLAAAPGQFTTSHPNFTWWPIFGHWPGDWWWGWDTLHNVRVDMSWASAPGQGNFRPGQVVTIRAGSRPGHNFYGWLVHSPTHPHLVLTNYRNPTTTFTMPRGGVHVEAIWWRIGEEPPHFPWRPGDVWFPGDARAPGVNWQVRNVGGVSFSYAASGFPETLAVNHGSTVTLEIRVDRHLAPFDSNLTGQWLRNGTAHGSVFPIMLSGAGIADIGLHIPSVTPATVGEYTLRVATVVNGFTTHVDVSRALALSVAGHGPATIWPQPPELPALADVNPHPTSRPALGLYEMPATPTIAGMAVLPAAASHNHALITGNLGANSVVLAMPPGTNEVRLYGKTLDAMIDDGTTLFVVNDIVWTIMSPEFLEHLRQRGGTAIGPNGGTFNIAINQTHGGETLVTAQIAITTRINGITRDLTDFYVPYAIAIELRDFGMYGANPNHIAALHAGSRLPGHVSADGTLSFNTVRTGSFAVNYMIN